MIPEGKFPKEEEKNLQNKSLYLFQVRGDRNHLNVIVDC